MYDLLIQRYIFKPSLTIGRVYSLIDNKLEFICFVLEDEARPQGVKIKELTCFPDGDYMVGVTYSNRFKRLLPIIYNKFDFSIVSGKAIWTGVRFHPGNTEQETEGCPLPGTTQDGKRTYDSKPAFDRLFAYIQEHPALKNQGYIRLRVINDQDGQLL